MTLVPCKAGLDSYWYNQIYCKNLCIVFQNTIHSLTS